MRKMEQLHPELREKIEELQRLCGERGLPLGIGECLRTEQEQDDLYAQGRTKPGPIVTYAPGYSYSSQHQWGIAVDFYKDVKGHAFDDDTFFREVGALAKSLGLAWGGDWKDFPDMPHIYLPYWGDTPAPLKRQYKTPGNFFASWETKEEQTKGIPLVVDGWCGPKTVRRLQEIFETPVDGIISDQWEWYREENPGLLAVEWKKEPESGSTLVKAIQAYTGVCQDRILGPETVKALQHRFQTVEDGVISGPSELVRALQRWCNEKGNYGRELESQ